MFLLIGVGHHVLVHGWVVTGEAVLRRVVVEVLLSGFPFGFELFDFLVEMYFFLELLVRIGQIFDGIIK